MAVTETRAVVRRWWAERQVPSAIWGTIIGASVMAAGDEGTSVGEVAATVIVTLIVYWLAERWSVVLGTQLTQEPLSFARARAVFREGWPTVRAAYLPVFVMLVAYLCGADADTSVLVALGVTIIVLIGLGVAAGRRAGMAVWGVIASATFTGLLGVILVVLKVITH